MFASLVPLISIIILLLSDICVLNIGKMKLDKALDAGCDAAEYEYRHHNGVLSEYIIKKVCTENYPNIKKLTVSSVLIGDKTHEEVCVEISACVDIPTSILVDNGNRYVSISSKKKRIITLRKQKAINSKE